jgi:hypothetical protein
VRVWEITAGVQIKHETWSLLIRRLKRRLSSTPLQWAWTTGHPFIDSIAPHLPLYPPPLHRRELPDHHRPSTADERHRRKGNPLPLRCPIPSLGVYCRELAWCTPPSFPMLEPLWNLHRIASFTAGSHIATHTPSVVIVLAHITGCPCHFQPWGGPSRPLDIDSSLGPTPTRYCSLFFSKSLFILIFIKFI